MPLVLESTFSMLDFVPFRQYFSGLCRGHEHFGINFDGKMYYQYKNITHKRQATRMRYIAFLLAALTTAEMQAFQLAPRLVVNVTIDQLRTDYMEAFAPLYSQGGFRRMLNEGLVYDGAIGC